MEICKRKQKNNREKLLTPIAGSLEISIKLINFQKKIKFPITGIKEEKPYLPWLWGMGG